VLKQLLASVSTSPQDVQHLMMLSQFPNLNRPRWQWWWCVFR